ncbi:MAG TPA: hypothetical protein VJB15_03665 [Rhodothermia bacterium]|nr:hypothetical protein [Rhodothermia bacterium]
MSSAAQATAGKSRTCPHCRATILQSASICPICQKSLRWDPHVAAHKSPSFSALKVEGTIQHPDAGDPWEYSVLLSIRNDRGEEIARQMVGVGGLQPHERRTFTVSVEVFKPEASDGVKTR